jgi:hypothetical protein
VGGFCFAGTSITIPQAHRRHMNESQRGMVAAKLANLPRGNPSGTNESIDSLPSRKEAGEMLNVGEATTSTASSASPRRAGGQDIDHRGHRKAPNFFKAPYGHNPNFLLGSKSSQLSQNQKVGPQGFEPWTKGL